MDEQELEARLRAADPARGPMPADSWVDDLVEATMTTETSTGTSKETGGQQDGRRRTWALAAAAAAVVAAIGGGAFALTAGDDDEGGRTAQDEAREELALGLPAQDPMQMCAVFSPEALAPMEVAFSGEAYEVEGDTVRLTPDHWYRGGDGADDVVLTAGRPEVLLEGGIAFEEGERYLVSAVDGEVATCGLSAPYTEEMAAAYDRAFAD
jgi:hypothetical protein